LRKLIRYAAAALITWAVITFAWAAFSHVTGFVGPARASAASLGFVASAVEFMDPPGLLGAPQRLAADRIRKAARTAGRFHRGPERAMARLVDRMGHASAHRHGRRHRHSRRGHVVVEFAPRDMAAEAMRLQSVIGLELHARGERSSQSAGLRTERARQRAERTGTRMERAMARAERRLHVETRPDGRSDHRSIHEFRFDEQERLVEDIQAAMGELEEHLSGIDEEVAGISDDRKERLKRRLEETIRKILDRLGDRMEEVSAEVTSELEELEIDVKDVNADQNPSRMRMRVRHR